MEPSPRSDPALGTIGECLDLAMDLTARYLSDRVGLSASAAFLLNRVRREGPTRLTTLAAREGVSQPSMTQLIQRLERQDLLTRSADPDDGRASLVGLTEDGNALMQDRQKIRRDRLDGLLDTLSADDEHALWLSCQVALPILHRLIDNADSAVSAGERLCSET